MNLTRGINLRKIAEMMPGASGAEVKVGVSEVYLDNSLLSLLLLLGWNDHALQSYWVDKEAKLV